MTNETPTDPRRTAMAFERDNDEGGSSKLDTLYASSAEPKPGSDEAPMRFHRLSGVRRQWWRPLLMLGLAAGAWIGLLTVALVTLTVIGSISSTVGRHMDRFASDTVSMGDPFSAVLMLGMLALAVPACRWAVARAGRRGGLDSVVGKIRWRLLVEALVPSFVAVGFYIGVGAFMDSPAGDGNSARWWAILVVLAVIPLQAAGEEYVFRGLLPQALGHWLKHPLWGVVISVPLFTIGHEYDGPGLLSIACFAGAAAWMVWRTGGLEVAIAWHAVNNMVVSALGLLGIADPDQTVIPWSAALLDILSMVFMVVIVETMWRHRWSRRFTAVRG
ncbi:CPBP family intramembrane glutamic endopeptidase [Propioniferax innocua]|nr:type II CAAX endopeptidase family protein [Propioniferax innocua]